jgi:phospholipid-translocating ATPase
VTPVFSEKNGEKIKEFQASSPDEVALVKFSESLGFSLMHREE